MQREMIRLRLVEVTMVRGAMASITHSQQWLRVTMLPSVVLVIMGSSSSSSRSSSSSSSSRSSNSKVVVWALEDPGHTRRELFRSCFQGYVPHANLESSRS